MDEARRILTAKGYRVVDEYPPDVAGWRALIFEPAVTYEEHTANGISGRSDQEIAERARELPRASDG
jgi:hypothetical protein